MDAGCNLRERKGKSRELGEWKENRFLEGDWWLDCFLEKCS